MALKVCGIDRAVKIGRIWVFGCVNSMPGGRFMRLFIIFAGFHQFGWILENVEQTLFLKIFEKFPFVSEWDCVKKVRGVQEVNRNMPRTPLSGLRRNHPLRRPCPTRKGGPCARGPSICRARLRFRSTGRGGAKVWQIGTKLTARKSRHTSGVESIFT